MDEKENNIKLMQELISEIDKHNYNYYVLDNPTISDSEYDKLYYSLVDLEKETGIILPNSPTQRVGGDVLDKFEKKRHLVPLYSLSKVRDFDDLTKWVRDMLKLSPHTKFALEYKFDGLQVVIEYDNGNFVSATTRGNGTIGEDVSLQVKTIKSVPLSIDYKGRLIVQGECMMTNKNFEIYNRTAEEKLKNPRNAAAGAVRNLDPKQTAKRNLDYFCYSILYCPERHFDTQEEMHEFLQQNGFQTGDYFKICNDENELIAEIEKVDKIKSALDVMIDGMVIKINDTKYRDEIGFTAKFPRWAMAYKFAATEATTLLKSVTWQVGRSGRVTPIANLEPVELAGATIKRATLNNIDDIRKKDIYENAMVFIRRSNEVIPEIMGLASKDENSRKIEIPSHCPSCNSLLVQKGPLLFCENHYGCREQIIDRLSHFCSRNAFNIEGVSEKSIEAFYEKLGVTKASDLFLLKEEDLLKLEGFKEKKAKNMINSIENSKIIELNRFLFALGIIEVGSKTARDIASHFKTLTGIKNASLESLAEIEDVGNIIAQNIFDFFRDQENLQEIDRLFKLGVKIKEVQTDQKSDILKGKTIVITGTLSRPRADFERMIEAHGGKSSSSVSAKTDFLLLGENAGSKLEKAKSLGIKILSEQDFLKLINE